MGEPEPERRRETKQKLRRPQGAGIWPEAVPRTEGQIRITTFLDSPLQVSPRSTKTMINGKNRLSSGRGELVTEAQNPNCFKRLRRVVGRLLPRCQIGYPSTTQSRIKGLLEARSESVRS